MSALAYFFEQTGDRRYLDAAEKAARYLTEKAWDESSSTFPFEPYSHPGQGRTYFFDCGIIARGLMAVWRSTQNSQFLERAADCALSMAFDFIADEAVHPVLSLPDKQPIAYEARWSRQPGCYQLKSSMAWSDLANITGRTELHRAFDRMLSYSLANHEMFLPGDPNPENVMDRLHAYCYFLEALLSVKDRPGVPEALRSGIARVAVLLREIRPMFARSDVYAQLLRLRVYADHLGLAPLDDDEAVEEAQQAAQFEVVEGPHAGGFWFGQKAGKMLPFVNPVSTAFCAQALAMWQQRVNGDFHASVSDLV